MVKLPMPPMPIEITEALEKLRMEHDTLRPADKVALRTIERAPDIRDLTKQITAYYGNLQRAERTPSCFLYLHLGMVAAILQELLNVIDRYPFVE